MWQLGEQARSRSGGWEGRIAALEKGGTRATLESGRDADQRRDRRPRPRRAAGRPSTTIGRSAATPGSRPAGPRRPDERAARRSGPPVRRPPATAATSGSGRCASIGPGRVASSLDLRGARVDEALEALDRYLDDAALAGLEQVVVIHGLGHGRAA